VISELIPSIANYLPSINLDLKNIFVAYQNQKKVLESEKGKASTILIGASLDFKINLGDLPLIGAKIPPEYSLTLENFQTLYISQEISPKTVDSQILKAANLEGANQETLPAGLTMSAQLKMGKDKPKLFTINIGGGSKSKEEKEIKATPQDEASNSEDKPSVSTKKPFKPSPGDRSIVWLDLNKTLGAVNIQQVGVQYQNSELWFFLNAALSFKGITLGCDNLGVGSSLKEFSPKFRLDGLSLHYKGGDTFEIGGAFLRKTLPLRDEKGNIVKDKDGKDKTYDEYSGAVILGIKLKAKKLTLAAIGSYTEIDGQASLFIYAFVGFPLGGPPAFFVTGLAAGFGYNRTLKPPTIDQVADFPLVKLAMGGDDVGKDLLAVLKDLSDYIPPSLGEMFFAIGIKFTSFKIIDAFILVIVKLGRRLEIYILGLAHLVAPAQIDESIPVVAEAKLAIKATFIPEEGFIGIEASLTEGSYILSKSCKLSGGFAFYTWFSGEHQGDFVLTLGGYHPEFKIPAHYPQVTPAQISWKLDDYISIKGSAYFALTPSNLMVGGSMEASFNKGDVAAWFKIEAHFLIAWQPFYYQAEVSLEIRIEVKIDLELVSTSLSLNLGARMKIWGPPFSGIAIVDVEGTSYEIQFGEKNQRQPKPLSWDNFKSSLLPAETEICTISVGDGLIGKIGKGKQEEWIINPKELVILADSAIPSSQVEIRGGNQNLKTLTNPGKVGIRPMAIKSDDLTITYQVEITRDNQVAEAEFSYIPVLKSAPIAMWGSTDSLLPENANEEKFIPCTLFGLEIRPAKPPEPGASQKIDYEKLLFNTQPGGNYQWQELKNIKIAPQEEDAKFEFEEEHTKRDEILAAFGFKPKEDFTLSKSIHEDLLGTPKIYHFEILKNNSG
jgi:hypothetical protein